MVSTRHPDVTVPGQPCYNRAMDENISWKIVIAGAAFSLLVLGIAYYLITPHESAFFSPEKIEKIAEFKETRVSGWKEGKRSWEFTAQEGWTNKNREITYLKGVKKGVIYKKGKVIIRDLSAPRTQVYGGTEIVETFNPQAYLDLGKVADNQAKSNRDWAKIRSDFLRYAPDDKKSEATGNVTLTKKDSSIFAQKILIDHDKNIAYISQNVKLFRKDGVLTTLTLQYLGQDERLEASDQVQLRVRENKLLTEINANHASFFTDVNKDVTFNGSLEVRQGKKVTVAEEGIYSQNKKELFLRRNVRAVFEKGGVILKPETAQKLKDPEVRIMLKAKTVLTASELSISTRNGDAAAQGSVLVTQKNREAKAEFATYDDRTESLTLTGNVYVKRLTQTTAPGNEWINAKKLVISVKDETFDAIGVTGARFKL